MLRLNLQKEPRWIDLAMGVRIQVLPVTTHAMTAAKRDRAFLEEMSRFQPEELTEEAARQVLMDTERGDALGIAMAKALARKVIIGWEGVGDEDGNPAEVTPEGIDALLDLWQMFQAFQVNYLQAALTLESEKNGSALSQNGTSAGAKTIARPARASAKTAQAKPTSRKR
jgi:hypothetical protein